MRSFLLASAAIIGILSSSAGWAQQGGAQVNLTPGMSTSALQNALNRAPRGAAVVFAPGAYALNSTLTVPCKDLHLTGPAAATPTATLTPRFQNGSLLAYTEGCRALGSIRYLHFERAGAAYFGGGDNSNFAFEHNLVTELPSGWGNATAEAALFFDGSLNTKLKNIVIKYNTFGDEKSCAAVFATTKDEGGHCAGVITSQGEDNNITIAYNNFVHVEQGVHFNQLAQFKPGDLNSVCISCSLQYNYIVHYHRIGIEIQTSTPSNPIQLEHNAIIDPVNSSYGTYAVSMACCQFGYYFATNGHSPGYVFNDNVLVATLPVGSECPPYGVEFWGMGPQGTNSLIQGTFCNGYTWGWGDGEWKISHNYICGPHFATKGGYISNQQHQHNEPHQSDNITDSKCLPTASKPPVISPSGGPISGQQLVTLSDDGMNTGIWYTTDGSNPVPGAGTARYYTSPFPLANASTVKAVGMWGAPNQPASYPTGYGYIPSKVVTASYTLGAAAKR
jgi:Chitobiase/beta-hexosaminidase C-terminal domain